MAAHIVLSFVCLLGLAMSIQGANFTMDIVLLNPHPPKTEEIIRQIVKLPTDKTYYIVGYEPLVSKELAHHLIMRACLTVTEVRKNVFSCGGDDLPYIYSWARGAPPLYLPPGVGFKFGKDSSMEGIWLGVHFADVSRFAEIDKSKIGVRILYTDTPQPKEAAVFILIGAGKVKPKTTERFDVACEVEDDVRMNIFAYRTHSHQLGKVMSGYVVHSASRNSQIWTLIGKKDPLLPQYFYPTTSVVVAQKGDKLAARCTMYNFKDYTVRTGPTNEDSMCNYYFMYWVENGKFPAKSSCFPMNGYTWETDARLTNIPNDSDSLKK